LLSQFTEVHNFIKIGHGFQSSKREGNHIDYSCGDKSKTMFRQYNLPLKVLIIGYFGIIDSF